MALNITPNVQGTVSVEELAAFCKENVRYDDEDSIMSAAEPLAALANDRLLLVNAINSVLYRRLASGSAMFFSTQSVLLYDDCNFKIRANIWKKPVERAGTIDHDNAVYSYDYAHNHNFQLLTVGYFGSGYRTDIHECDPAAIVGYAGEKVELRFLERTSLPRGKVMLYRTLKDIHIQHPPEEFSISLNLIVQDPTGYVADQYNFDIESSTIMRFLSVPMGAHHSVLTFATVLGSIANFDAAMAVAKGDAHWRVRLAAFECCASLASEQARAVWTEAFVDSHPKVRESASGYLQRC